MDFLTYTALYHFTLMMIGLAAIFMGYRLFVLEIMPQQGSDVSAEAGKARLTIKNAAPGTIFCAFGTVLIIYMIHQGPPKQEFSIKTPDGTEIQSTTRGNDGSLNRVLAQADDLLKSSQPQNAFALLLQAYGNDDLTQYETLPLLTAMAEVRFDENKFIQAATYSQLAVEIDSAYVEALVVYGKSLKALNQTSQAIEFLQKAAEIDNNYYSLLNRWQSERNR